MALVHYVWKKKRVQCDGTGTMSAKNKCDGTSTQNVMVLVNVEKGCSEKH